MSERTNYKEDIKKTSEEPMIACENKSGSIVLDVETTGLNEYYNEILQISIIDGEGNTLMDTYVKPLFEDSWEDAERINRISPEMVKDSPTILDLIPQLKGIFASANELILYNAPFDLSFIEHHTGIAVRENQRVTDVMLDFAKYYGEWNDYFHDYKWQKLTTAADHFGYEWELDAHNSLADVKATLFVKEKLEELKLEKQLGEKELLSENNIKSGEQTEKKIHAPIR